MKDVKYLNAASAWAIEDKPILEALDRPHADSLELFQR